MARVKNSVIWPWNCPLVDFTEFTTSADYIHSAELVNTRYPHQTVLRPNAPETTHKAGNPALGSGREPVWLSHIESKDGDVRGRNTANSTRLPQIPGLNSRKLLLRLGT